MRKSIKRNSYFLSSLIVMLTLYDSPVITLCVSVVNEIIKRYHNEVTSLQAGRECQFSVSAWQFFLDSTCSKRKKNCFESLFWIIWLILIIYFCNIKTVQSFMTNNWIEEISSKSKCSFDVTSTCKVWNVNNRIMLYIICVFICIECR